MSAMSERLIELENLRDRYYIMVDAHRQRSREYQRARYNSDPEFKRACIEKAKRYYQENKQLVKERANRRRLDQQLLGS